MNANAILVAYMIENDMRVAPDGLPMRLAKVRNFRADVYFSTFVAAVAYLALATL
jgi:hypothetical protein